MSRPSGEPAALSALARGLAAAAQALGGIRAGLHGTTSFVVVAGAWRGPASQAFLLDGARHQTGLDRAADALAQAAGALAELAARLADAQATWDRAQRLAATVGVNLDPHDPGPPPTESSRTFPPGPLLAPTGAVDLAVAAVTAQAARLADAANQEAAAARRAAAARLDQLAPVGRHRGAPRHHGARDHDPEGRHGGGIRKAVGEALEAGAEVAVTTHHLLAAVEARVEAAGRLAETADDPAVRAAASRVAETAGRPLLDGRVLGALPLVAPVLDFAAAVHHGESLPRAAAGAIGAAVGADVGGRVGLALCGGQAAATQGAGLVVCPALTAVGGAVGSSAGRSAALHLYDAAAGRLGPPPAGRGAR